jgi:hypothetical protein
MLIENHRMVTCAPTNTVVAEVASWVLGVIKESGGGGVATKCFFGDVVLFGNEDRMAMDWKLLRWTQIDLTNNLNHRELTLVLLL